MFRRTVALIVALTVTAIGCSSAIPNKDAIIPFSARSYPAEGPATCPKDDAGNTSLGFRRIVAVDEHTVRFELCTPDAAFLEKISLASFTISDSGHLTTATANGTINTDPIGTGPFYLKRWEAGSQIVMKRFDGYWGEKAKSETLVLNWQKEAAGRLITLQAATSDVISAIAPDDAATADADPTISTHARKPVQPSFLFMNNTYKPFDDVRVRRAVGLAIDTKRLAENFYPKGSVAAKYLVPCDIPLGCVGDEWPARDITEAKRLLAEAGFPNGFETSLTYRDTVTATTPTPLETVTDIQAQLAEIGITANIVALDRTAFTADRRAGKLAGIVYDGFAMDFLEPSDILKWIFVDLPKRFGVVDRSISDPINAAVLTVDKGRRAELYAKANNAIRSLVPLVPLVSASSIAATRADVTGFVPSALQYERAAPVIASGRSTLIWTLAEEPVGLWCAEGQGIELAKICVQMLEGLYGLSGETAEPAPLLATKCESSQDGLSWTCALRKGVRFHNGASFDAGDVLDSFAAMWDCASPLHKGNPGVFSFMYLLTPFLNEDSCKK